MEPCSARSPQNEEPARTYRAEATDEVSHSLQPPYAILNKYGSKMKRLRSDQFHEQSLEIEMTKGLREEAGSSHLNRQVLTAASIMRMAKMALIQSKASKKPDCSTGPPKPYVFDSGIPYEHIKHIRRAMALFDAEGRFSNQQYDEAEKLLGYILTALDADHPVERLITYFAYDLREKISEVNNEIDLEREVVCVDLEQAVVDMRQAIQTCEQRLPFSQIVHFTGIQFILDHMDSAERIHIIDIGIKLSSHWMIIMNDLSNRKSHPLKQLTITVVCNPNDTVEQTGKLLTFFAESLNLPFVFKILYSQLDELNNEQFELEAGELVAVYLEFRLTYLSDSLTKLESLVRGVKSLRPHLMVVSELEADTSGSTFFDRFEKAVSLCCAKFDCLEHCLEQNSHCRELLEKIYFQEVISKGIMSEDARNFRQHLTIDTWREYFKRFGIVEAELSQPSIYQACLMIRESRLWHYCTLTVNGECMLLGWNEIPLHSVSAWKFQHD